MPLSTHSSLNFTSFNFGGYQFHHPPRCVGYSVLFTALLLSLGLCSYPCEPPSSQVFQLISVRPHRVRPVQPGRFPEPQLRGRGFPRICCRGHSTRAAGTAGRASELRGGVCAAAAIRNWHWHTDGSKPRNRLNHHQRYRQLDASGSGSQCILGSHDLSECDGGEGGGLINIGTRGEG